MTIIRAVVLGPIGRSRLWAVLLALCAAAPAWPQPPAVTDASVDAAIQDAVTWLKAQRKDSGHWEQYDNPADRYWGGDTGLAVLSLLYAGENPQSAFMESALGWLSGQTLRATYTYGTRAHALALVPGEKYRGRLQADLEWLLQNVWPPDGSSAGAYDYEARLGDAKSGRWDNSNSQYGVLGAWMATDAGLDAPTAYWESVGQHWMKCQQKDGGWAYQEGGNSTGSMTAAGLATLFVVLDRVYAEHPRDAGPLLGAIKSGLDWFGREYKPQENPFGESRWLYYYLYGVERVGRASGYKYFREKDWFHEGAAFLLGTQDKDGAWRGSGEDMHALRNTAFALMFLCHGRAPLLFNKLEHGAEWNDRMRDVAGLTHFSQRTLERLLNWQIVRLDSAIDDLMEAPVLYLYGRSAWTVEEVHVQKIREYCLRGGMVLAVTAGGEFAASIRDLAERAFPEHHLRPLSSEHALFNGEIQFAIDKPPEMMEVHNGIRTLLLTCGQDLAETWARGKGRKGPLELGCNIYNYATDKTTLRSRLQTANIPLRQVEATRKIEVAIIRYNGTWSIEPHGWTRLKNYLNNETGARLLVTSGLSLDSEDLKKFRIAYITGLGAFELSPEEQKGLQRFVRDGGTLLADAAAGRDEFRAALEAQVSAALNVEPAKLPADSFLFSGAGIPGAVDLAGVNYTRAARGRSAEKYPLLRACDVGRRLAVIYSPLDLSAGLLGTHIYGRRGYEGDGSLRILRNLLLYADLPSRDKARLGRQ